MGAAGRLEPGKAFRRFDPSNQSAAGQGGQRPVDCIQGKSGQFPMEPLVQSFRRRMISGQQKFPVDLQALMGHLETCRPAGPFKSRDFCLYGFHSLFCVSRRRIGL